MPAAFHEGAVVVNFAVSAATRVPAAKFSVTPVFGITYVAAVPSAICGPNVRPASSEIWKMMPAVPLVPPVMTLKKTL